MVEEQMELPVDQTPEEETQPSLSFEDSSGEEIVNDLETEEPTDAGGSNYKSIQAAEQAAEEAKRRMHEATEEAAELRGRVSQFEQQQQTFQQQQQRSQQQQGSQTRDEQNEMFREHLSEDPIGAFERMVGVINQSHQNQTTQQQQQVMDDYNHFASDPEFADVADEVAKALPTTKETSMESLFLKTKMNKLKNFGATQKAEDMSRKAFSESGVGQGSRDDGVQIVVGPEERKFARAFGMSDKDLRKHLVDTYKRNKGKIDPREARQVSIDEYPEFINVGGE